MKKLILVIAMLVICVAAQANDFNFSSILKSWNNDPTSYVTLAVTADKVGSNWNWEYIFTPTNGSIWAIDLALGSPALGSIVGGVSGVTTTSGWSKAFYGDSIMSSTGTPTSSPVSIYFTSIWGPKTDATASAIANNGQGFDGNTVAPIVPEPATLAGLAAFLPAGLMFLKRKK